MLRLYPNSAHSGGRMRVFSMTVDGEIAAPRPFVRDGLIDDTLLQVPLSVPLAPGAALRASLGYEINIPFDPSTNYNTFGLSRGIMALPEAYALVPPRDAAGAWQVDPLPTYGDIVRSEVALMRVRIRAPLTWHMAASGSCQYAPIDAQMRELDCVAGPVRDFAVHLSAGYRERSAQVPSVAGEPITLSSHFSVRKAAAGARALTIAADALAVYEARFGAYPYRSLSVFESPSPIGGIEYPTSIGVEPQSDATYYEWLVAHEVAHQWWYGMVGSDPVNEAWLDEALTQYSTLLYFEAKHGRAAAEQQGRRYFDERLRKEIAERGDSRVDQPSAAFLRWAYAPIIYGKAPKFFAQVREQAGDVAFFSWLRSYFDGHRFGTATGADLLRAADAAGIGAQARSAHARWILGVAAPSEAPPRRLPT